MDRTNILAKRLRAETIGQVIHVLSTSLLFVVLARLLEPDEYGTVFLVVAVIHVAVVASDWGIGRSTGRYVATYRSDAPSQVTHVVRFGAVVALLSALVVAAVLYGLAPIVASLAGAPDAESYVRVGALVLMAFSGVSFCRNAFQGFERIEFAAFTQAADGFGRFVFSIAFVLLYGDGFGALFGFAVGSGLATVLSSCALYWRCYTSFTDERGQREPGLYRRIVEYAVPLTATRGARQLDKQVDTILVGAILTPVAVAYYTLAKQVVTVVDRPASIVGFTMAPTIGADYASGDRTGAKRLYETAFKNTLALYLPAGVGIVLIAHPTIDLLFGSEYAGAGPVLQILAAYAVLQGISKITGDTLDYLGRAKARAYVKVTTAVANAGLTIALVSSIGVTGAAWATVGTSLVYVALNVWIMDRVVDLDTRALVGFVVRTTAVTAFMGAGVAAVLALSASSLAVLPAISVGVGIWAGGIYLTNLVDVRQVRSMIVDTSR